MSPMEIVANADKADVTKAIRKAEEAGERPPDGFIRASGKMMAVWLPPGVTEKDLGLRAWSPTRRWTT
jgi:hypothetical protein